MPGIESRQLFGAPAAVSMDRSFLDIVGMSNTPRRQNGPPWGCEVTGERASSVSDAADEDGQVDSVSNIPVDAETIRRMASIVDAAAAHRRAQRAADELYQQMLSIPDSKAAARDGAFDGWRQARLDTEACAAELDRLLETHPQREGAPPRVRQEKGAGRRARNWLIRLAAALR